MSVLQRRFATSRMRRRHRGFALAAVVPLILLGLIAWGGTYRHLSPILKLEERAAELKKQALASQPALARGVDLLRTGTPPESPYTCRIVFAQQGGKAERDVTFSKFGPDLWQVADMPATGSRDRCPDAFIEESS